MANLVKIRAFGEWEDQELLMLSIPHINSDWAEYLDEILDSYEEFNNAIKTTLENKIRARRNEKKTANIFKRFWNNYRKKESELVPSYMHR